jgi:competence protein ComEA
VDSNPAPWRVLEDPVSGADAAAQPEKASLAVPRWVVVSGVVAVLLTIGAFFLAAGSSSGSVVVQGGAPLTVAASGAVSGAAATSATGRILVVEIVGAVDHPGVFRLAAGSRIGDLIDAAGGYGPRVDADRAARALNLAAPLADGDQVRVPSRDDELGSAAASGTAPHTAAPGAPIDLNRATAAELDTLPGVGPATAAKILASRDEQPFASVDDLRTRKLVGEKTFEKLKDLVAVR